ncbi:MAG TPA: hypothetical protein VGC18_04915 [Lacisediminihabitans sp.]|uniref:hypothetical protein n=1 Tax=Lacisediminihabitans sp. TaxID=2787631 RepID=UPI002ED86A5C
MRPLRTALTVRVITWIAIGAAGVFSSGAILNQHGAESTTANRQLAEKTTQQLLDEQLLIAHIDTDAKAIDTLVAASAGKVLDPAVLSTASAAAAKAYASETRLEHAIDTARTAVARSTAKGTPPPKRYQTAAEKAYKQAVADRITLNANTTTITTAVAAWQAEQARIAAAKAAAEAAARAAAEQAAQQAAAQAAARAAARAHAPRAASRTTTSAPVSAPAASGDKLAIAQATFARFGFSNVVYNSGQSQGHYAATDLNRRVIYLQLSIIPADRVASVAIHEYMHIIQSRTYGGYAQTVAHFGSVLAMEKNADAMARANGATWTAY